jgi:bifunctional DNase/RNase
MVEVVVSRLGIDPSSQAYVVVLQEKGGGRLLPIWIGQVEAESIVRHMHNTKRERPLTHDLCKSIIAATGSVLRRVEITHVENNTYIAELHLERNGTIVRVDTRPSDAIAIAVRTESPIFAADDLLATPDEDDDEDSDTATFGRPTAVDEGSELTAEQLKAYLEHLRPEDFGKFNL